MSSASPNAIGLRSDWALDRVPAASAEGGRHHPAGCRRPGQRREPVAIVRSLQPGEMRLAAGIPGGQVAGAGDRGVK